MRAALGVALGLFAVLSGPASAQETAVVREARCWIGSSTFSAGAAMSVGDAVAVCDSTSGWKAPAVAVSASGCLLEGKLSSTGAILGVRNGDTMLVKCDAGGTWVTVDAKPEG